MVAPYLGDGVLADFGYPTAHEDDAERAVRAGFATLEAVNSLQPLPSTILQARIGIASGVVIVGDLVCKGGATGESIPKRTTYSPKCTAVLPRASTPST